MIRSGPLLTYLRQDGHALVLRLPGQQQDAGHVGSGSRGRGLDPLLLHLDLVRGLLGHLLQRVRGVHGVLCVGVSGWVEWTRARQGKWDVPL